MVKIEFWGHICLLRSKKCFSDVFYTLEDAFYNFLIIFEVFKISNFCDFFMSNLPYKDDFTWAEKCSRCVRMGFIPPPIPFLLPMKIKAKFHEFWLKIRLLSFAGLYWNFHTVEIADFCLKIAKNFQIQF